MKGRNLILEKKFIRKLVTCVRILVTGVGILGGIQYPIWEPPLADLAISCK